MCIYIVERSKKTLEAATAMKLRSNDLLDLKIIDEIIKEPSGGAHRDKDKMLLELRKSISRHLGELNTMSKQDIIDHRKNKFLNIGREKSLPKEFLSSEELFSKSAKKIFSVNNSLWKNKYLISSFCFCYFNFIIILTVVIKNHSNACIFYLIHKNKVHFYQFSFYLHRPLFCFV